MIPLCYVNVAAGLQRIADYLRRAHPYWIAGEVPRDKSIFLWEKLARRYPLDYGRMTASRVRRGGGITFRLVMLLLPRNGDKVHWVLLASNDPEDGEPWIHFLSADRHGRTPRLRIGAFEVVRTPRPRLAKSADRSHGAEKRSGNVSQPVVTWRMTDSIWQSHREELVLLVRRRQDAELACKFDALKSVPGLRAIREQVRRLHLAAKGEWIRSRRRDESMPMAAMPGWTRRKSDDASTVPLARIVFGGQRKTGSVQVHADPGDRQ